MDNISSAVGAGVTVASSGEGFYFSVGWNLTTQYGDQYTFTRTESEGLGTLPNPMPNLASNPVDHDQDTFWLWIKPQMHYVQKYRSVPDISMNYIAPDKGIVAVPVTVAQLLGKAPDLNGVMNGWTPGDKANLLNQDPFLSRTYQVDSKRYTFNREVLLLGPLSAGGAIPTEPLNITYTGQDCKSVQIQEQSTVSLGVTANLSFFVAEQLQVYGTLTTTETASAATCNQLMQTLQWTPGSDVVGYSHFIDVYVDNLFGTLAFVDKGPTSATSADSATISGTTLSSDNKPAKYQQIDILLSDGRLLSLLSDNNGNFKTVVPIGTTTIKTSAAEQKIMTKNGGAIVKTLHVASIAPPHH